MENLRKEFEILANRYGLSLPAKLKKGNLVLEWKPLPGEIQNNTEKKFGKVKLKTISIDSKIKQKIKLDKDDIKLIKKEASYFFKTYSYSKNVPKIYI